MWYIKRFLDSLKGFGNHSCDLSPLETISRYRKKALLLRNTKDGIYINVHIFQREEISNARALNVPKPTPDRFLIAFIALVEVLYKPWLLADLLSSLPVD